MRPSLRIAAAVVFIGLPSIQFGGWFILKILSGQEAELALTPFQEGMFRAGHGHAGVLVILALAALPLAAHARLGRVGHWLVCIGFPLAAVLVSGGFFAAAIGPGRTEPSGLIAVLYAGIALLAACALTLGVGLVRGALPELRPRRPRAA